VVQKAHTADRVIHKITEASLLHFLNTYFKIMFFLSGSLIYIALFIDWENSEKHYEQTAKTIV
jgi:hypothetical protein